MSDQPPTVPIAISQRSLPDSIRYFVSQLMQRAAQPGPNGDPDLELGSLAIALDMVAGDAAQQIAKLTEERALAVAHDRQPYPTAWAYEQVCAARTAHQERADAAEAVIARVRLLHDRLTASDELTDPDDLITRGAAAKRIATALDGRA